MRAGRVGAVPPALVVLCAALGGCGHSSATRAPGAAEVPLLPGATIVRQVQACDRGANAFCSTQLVVVDPHFGTSQELLEREHAHLLALGWSGADADIGAEHAATSPGGKLRLTYATPSGDLEGIDLGWIHRSSAISQSLAEAMFAQSSALSMMLEPGPA